MNQNIYTFYFSVISIISILIIFVYFFCIVMINNITTMNYKRLVIMYLTLKRSLQLYRPEKK